MAERRKVRVSGYRRDGKKVKGYTRKKPQGGQVAGYTYVNSAGKRVTVSGYKRQTGGKPKKTKKQRNVIVRSKPKHHLRGGWRGKGWTDIFSGEDLSKFTEKTRKSIRYGSDNWKLGGRRKLTEVGNMRYVKQADGTWFRDKEYEQMQWDKGTPYIKFRTEGSRGYGKGNYDGTGSRGIFAPGDHREHIGGRSTGGYVGRAQRAYNTEQVIATGFTPGVGMEQSLLSQATGGQYDSRARDYFKENYQHQSFLQVFGTSEFMQNLQGLGNEIDMQLTEISLEAGEHILDTASDTIPRDTGWMDSTGYVEASGSLGHIEIGYHANYAMEQHEGTWYQHNPPQRAKWLELTMQEQAEYVFDMMAERVNEILMNAELEHDPDEIKSKARTAMQNFMEMF